MVEFWPILLSKFASAHWGFEIINLCVLKIQLQLDLSSTSTAPWWVWFGIIVYRLIQFGFVFICQADGITFDSRIHPEHIVAEVFWHACFSFSFSFHSLMLILNNFRIWGRPDCFLILFWYIKLHNSQKLKFNFSINLTLK